jgi:quinoprotein glucose dehydrogenase
MQSAASVCRPPLGDPCAACSHVARTEVRGVAGTSVYTAAPVIARTFLDSHLRAFEVGGGRKLWSAELPAPGHATPMTYEFHGKQYVVVAAGGDARFTEEPQSDAVVAFALH